MRAVVLLLGLLLFGATFPASAAPCASAPPWGLPVFNSHTILSVACHAAYVSAVDPTTKEPRWVAYELTGPHTLGCGSRVGLSFKVDPLVPPQDQGRDADYVGSGYDIGHMMPNEDAAWNASVQADTFSFANVVPQLPGLNRQGWEEAEQFVRAWALSHGDLIVYTGPIYGNASDAIGADRLPVPMAFFKIAIDRRTNEVVGIEMPQQSIAKANAAQYGASIARIEADTDIKFPLPPGANENAGATLWPADLKGWNAAHRTTCH